MKSLRSRLLSTTVIPIVVGVGVGIGGVLATGDPGPAASWHGKTSVAQNPCAAKNPCAARNPCAAANPCAAKAPCAAKGPCAPRSPCAAGPCSPCAAGGTAPASKCVVPRLAKAAVSPCAPKSPCAPSPCAPSPCAAKSPCAPKSPCAAKSPCAPSPCAAKSPCAAAAPSELTEAEAKAAYACISKELRAAYKKSGLRIATQYPKWKHYNSVSYLSATHGGRYVNNHANAKAKRYGMFEKAGKMPKGSILAKDSFAVTAGGRVGVGPLFIMEKMGSGFNKASGDWRYTMVMPDGSVFGRTKGKGSAKVQFCAECHITAAETDSMFFMPEEVRVK